ncbi:MAG TPA: M56 family metallopeptidase [Longimicrobiales bacterium]|jgi:hypothetical protein
MIAVWMAYAALVALLLGFAAAQAERALRLHGRPARWIWAATMLGSWALPLVTWLVPRGGGSPAGTLVAFPVSAETPGALPAPTTGLPLALWFERARDALATVLRDASRAEGLDTALAVGWILLATTAAVLLAGAYHRLARRVREWPEAPQLGDRVVLSHDFGPAVLGVRRALIVLPRWVLGLDPIERHLVLTHEEEHRRARDTLLLAGGVAAVAAAPWNLFLWWHLRRLRLAVEFDCDGRVLSGGASPRRYGDLLLSVGQRMSGTRVPMAALAAPPSSLERRLKMIAERNSGGSPWRSAMAIVIAGALVGVACETPPPSGVEAPAVADESVMSAAELPEVTVGAVTLREVTVSAAELPEITVGAVTLREVTEGAVPAREVARLGEVALVELAATAEARTIAATLGATPPPDGVLVGAARKVEGVLRRLTGEARAEAVATVREAPVVATVDESALLERKPLLVVDGVITSREITNLDATNVESVEIVKGPAALAIYGERAAGGLIQVRTKDGPRGTLTPTPGPVIYVDGERFHGTLEAVRSLDIESIEVIKGAAAAELGEEAGARGVIRVTTRR